MPSGNAGAYLKLVSDPAKASGLLPDSRYSIMFGPDLCGATNKVHLIICYTKPDGTVEEKHLSDPPRAKHDKLR